MPRDEPPRDHAEHDDETKVVAAGAPRGARNVPSGVPTSPMPGGRSTTLMQALRRWP